MLLNRRVVVALVCAGALVMAGVSLLLWQSHAQASGPLTYARLTKLQKRLVSQPLASALQASSSSPSAHAQVAPGGDQNGSGADGLPNTPPAAFAPDSGSSGSAANYYPSANGQCSAQLGNNVKVNQNCLNVSDKDLQGRAQANNETAIAQDPFSPNHIVASDNNYIRGDGTCGAHYSLDRGRTWNDSTVPNGFTRGMDTTSATGFNNGAARQYWHAGGDTSVAWDTRGNAYLSCQLFNRGTPTTPNPDQSSAFVVFRSTANNGASWNFPGRYVAAAFDPTGTGAPFEDKQLIAVDNHVNSPYRDRVYVTWTEFAADGTAYIYEAYSKDYGETFSKRVLVSEDSPLCPNALGAATPNGNCNMNQFSDPFVGSDGNLYVVYINNNSRPTSDQVLLSKSTDGGQSFSPPVKVSDYYDLPDCDTYQGAGADPGRSCVPEKGSSTKSVFRATNYPSGQVDPRNPSRVTVTFGSYINRDSNERNGCTPAGYDADFDPLYTGVKTPGACNNKILLSVSTDAGATFTGTATDPRAEPVIPQARGQKKTDQFWQWSAFTRDGRLAVNYYDRQYGSDETNGFSDVTLSGSSNLVDFGQTRVTSSSMPPPTEFTNARGAGVFYGDYTGLAAVDEAHPIWMDTRSKDLFLCPGTSTGPGNPPKLCGATEPNGQPANDQDVFTATVDVPTQEQSQR